ncbi:hypothetical protein GCM10010530_71120 [Kribbella aluminosa]
MTPASSAAVTDRACSLRIPLGADVVVCGLSLRRVHAIDLVREAGSVPVMAIVIAIARRQPLNPPPC